MDKLRKAIEKEEDNLIKETLKKKLEEMESKSEVRTDWKNVKGDFRKLFQESKEDNRRLMTEAKFIKDVALHTRLMVEDLRYKASRYDISDKYERTV